MQEEMIIGKKYKVIEGVKFPNRSKVGIYLDHWANICGFELNNGDKISMDATRSVFARVKKKINRESGFITMFRDFIADEMSKDPLFIVGPHVWEHKVAETSRFEFSDVKPHQIQGLLDAKNGRGIFHKISDMPIFGGHKTRFTLKKPFDAFFIQHAKAYVVIWFYKPRQKKVMHWIDVDMFIKMVDTIWHNSNFKSCTEEELKPWADYTFEFKDLSAQKRRGKK